MVEKVIKRFNETEQKEFKTTEDNLQLQMMALAIQTKRKLENAIDEDIDFSIKSLGHIDDFLESLHKEYTKEGSDFDDDLHTGICFGVGAYIGETIRNMIDVNWAMGGDGIPCLEFKSNDGMWNSFPIRKVAKRLSNGEEDNIQGFAITTLEYAKEYV